MRRRKDSRVINIAVNGHPQELTVRLRLQNVSTVSDSNAIILSIQIRRTILSEHHPTGSTPPYLRRFRLTVAGSPQTMLLQRPALL